jgi:hypothetical protein
MSTQIDATLVFREGKGFWWFKESPAQIRLFVFSKYLVSFLINMLVISVGLGCLLALFGQGVTAEMAAIAWMRLAGVSLCYSGFSILVGSLAPGFHLSIFRLNAFGTICSIVLSIGGMLYFGYSMNFFLVGIGSARIYFEIAVGLLTSWGCLRCSAFQLEKIEWEM